MKRFIKLSFVLLAMLGVLFTSCKKEYENPPIDPFPEGEIISIGDILAMNPNTSFNGVSVCGIVTADEQSGNLYKQIFIQDRASGKAIELMLNTSSAARIGDKVRVYLDSTIMFNVYHNLPQLVNSADGKGFNPDKHLYIYPHSDTVAPIEPKTVTIADIKSGLYTAALVRLENVEFVEPFKPFCDLGATTNRNLKDATGEVIVRTSNYANFAYDIIPSGSGSLVAIASVYNSDWQLILRSVHNQEDFKFDGGGIPPTPAGELQSMSYSQSFAADFGTYLTYDVTGPQSWYIDYSCAVMKGYDGTNYVNEDWLISSPVAIVDVANAKVSVNYVAQYPSSNPEDVTLQVSTDYVYGDAPSKANWTQMSTTYPNTGGWSDFQTVETSLNDFIGQNITVAIKFTSSETQSRTFEVKSITVQEGEAGGGGGGGGGTPGEGEGSGTQDDPYNVAAGISLQGQNVIGWVHGYIVGAANAESTVSSNDDVDWAAPFTKATNVLIADDPDCREVSQCIIVNLPSGKPLRSQVNLVDNPGNLGKQLSVNGKLRTYFGQAGLRDSGGTEADFELEGGGGGGGGTGGEEYFNAPLTTQASFDSFYAASVTGDQEWSFDSRYGAVMSGYVNGTSYANEDWFISPVIDLSASTNPVLVFDHTRGPAGSINVGVTEGYYTVWITDDYTDGENPNEERWTEISGVNHATSAWAWVSSGALAIPEGYKVATCRIAFRYQSIDGASATWEIKNMVVREQ